METAIPQLTMKCECGESFVVTNVTGSRCKCGKFNETPMRTPGYSEIFALFGFHIHQDIDGDLFIESDQQVPVNVIQWLKKHQGTIRTRMDCMRRRALRIFIGGSLNGKAYATFCLCVGERKHMQIGPRHWETYERRDMIDERLYFVGRATSKEKAKRSRFV
jgi:hypothetical protein